jgi:death on curing protein
MAKDWVWVSRRVAMAAHDEQLAAHGGGEGVRDATLLDSALARPPNLAVCGEPDVAALAASYAYGIARNHPFVDGNKLTATDAQAVVAFLALAAGELSEDELADWFRTRIEAM